MWSSKLENCGWANYPMSCRAPGRESTPARCHSARLVTTRGSAKKSCIETFTQTLDTCHLPKDSCRPVTPPQFSTTVEPEPNHTVHHWTGKDYWWLHRFGDETDFKGDVLFVQMWPPAAHWQNVKTWEVGGWVLVARGNWRSIIIIALVCCHSNHSALACPCVASPISHLS